MGVDVFDFTLLQKKGLLKIKEDKTPDVIDFRNTKSEVNNVTNGAVESSPAPAFDFLNTIAASSADNNSNVTSVSEMPSVGDLKSNSDFSGLAVKVDNLEYKLERLLEKFASIESKFEDMIRNVR